MSSTTAILQPVRMPGSMPSTLELSGGRREQQVFQILAEDLDGLFVRALFQFQPDFGLDRRVEQALVGIFDRELEVRSPVAGLLAESCS